MGTNTTAQLVAQLLQAQKEGTLTDVAGQLHGTHPDELAKIKFLVQAVSDTAKLEWSYWPPTDETSTDYDSDSLASAGKEMDGATTEASNTDESSLARPARFATPWFSDLLRQTDSDVILESEQDSYDQPGKYHSATWEECVEWEEADWPVHFPPSKPFLKPRKE